MSNRLAYSLLLMGIFSQLRILLLRCVCQGDIKTSQYTLSQQHHSCYLGSSWIGIFCFPYVVGWCVVVWCMILYSGYYVFWCLGSLFAFCSNYYQRLNVSNFVVSLAQTEHRLFQAQSSKYETHKEINLSSMQTLKLTQTRQVCQKLD